MFASQVVSNRYMKNAKDGLVSVISTVVSIIGGGRDSAVLSLPNTIRLEGITDVIEG